MEELEYGILLQKPKVNKTHVMLTRYELGKYTTCRGIIYAVLCYTICHSLIAILNIINRDN